MYILNKKRIYLIFSCLILSTIVFQLTSSSNIITEKTVALPVNNKTIIIDAGHGRRRPEEQ